VTIMTGRTIGATAPGTKPTGSASGRLSAPLMPDRDGARRDAWRRPVLRYGLLGCALATALLAAGCGGGSGRPGRVPASTGDARAATASILASLSSTSIPSTILALTYTAKNPPAACQVLPPAANSTTYSLFVYWVPRLLADNPSVMFYTWLSGDLSENPSTDAVHISYTEANASSEASAQILRTHIPQTFFSPEVEKCRMLSTGALRLAG
jgi:hypothetical protein